MKKWRNVIIGTVLALVMTTSAACVDNNKPSELPGDTYIDYTPDKNPGGGQFDFDGNYAPPELTIDGVQGEDQWKTAKELASFGQGNAATVKAYRGDAALFFFFEVKDKTLLTEGNTNDDAVTRSDSIEFYLDTQADGGKKPQMDDYQINLGIHGKTRIMQGAGNGWGNWNGLIDYEVKLNGTLNNTSDEDVGYAVEVMIPYSQIGIEKSDTIAVTFGQVNKTKSNGSAAGDHWDWYGWTYDGVLCEPQTIDNYVLLDKDNVLTSRDNVERPDAEMLGYVKDETTGEPIGGVTVTTTVADTVTTKTTDNQGYFNFGKVDPDHDYVVNVEREGYLANSVTFTRAELRKANGGQVIKEITMLSTATIQYTTLSGSVRNIVNGAVEGVTVKIDGTTITGTTGADGTFEIPQVPGNKDVSIVLSKAGYADGGMSIAQDDIVLDGEKITTLGEINLSLNGNKTGSFGLKSDKFADSNAQVLRTLTGVEVRFAGERKLSGNIEFFLDTKASGATRNSTDYLFTLSDAGSISINNFGGTNTNMSTLTWTIAENTDAGYTGVFTIPYAFLGIEPTEVFGISAGQWSETAKDWDGWGYNGTFVAPEIPSGYVRVSKLTTFYKAVDNTYENSPSSATLEELKVSGVSVAGFDKNTLEYTYEFDHGVVPTAEMIAATAHHPKATVTVTVDAANSKIKISVRSLDGTESKLYTINYTNAAEGTASKDATLSAITIDGVALEGFASTTLNYTYKISFDTVESDIQVVATTTDPDANAVATLAADKKSISVVVTAEDTTVTATYTITLNATPDTKVVSSANAGVKQYIDVTRDAVGTKFEIYTDKKLPDGAFSLLYTDFGADTTTAGWVAGSTDYQIKIYGNGNVFYKKSTTPWWKTDHASLDKKTATVTAGAAGMYCYTFVMDYQTFGYSADDIFGFAFLQASGDNAGDYTLLNEGCHLDGKAIGDVALQTNFIRCDKNAHLYKKASNTPDTSGVVDKEAITRGYPVKFSDPADVGAASADEFYLKLTRDATGVNFQLVVFGDFKAGEFITLVVHGGTTDGGGWALQATDVMFKITPDGKIYHKSGLADFWGWQNINAETDAKLGTDATVTAETGYKTIAFTIPYSAMGGIDQDASFGLMAAECADRGAGANMEIYNADPWGNYCKLNGVGVGDPAAQSKYLQVAADGAFSLKA